MAAGDSACSIPPQTIPAECLEVIRDWTSKLAKELKVVGLINIQYCIQDNQVSHSVPHLATICPWSGLDTIESKRTTDFVLSFTCT